VIDPPGDAEATLMTTTTQTRGLPEIPYLTTEQMVAVDRAMEKVYHIPLISMMENAGHHLAHLARTRCLDGNPLGCRVAVLAGRGGNGGGALACARRLHTWGARVWVFLSRKPAAFSGVPARQLRMLHALEVPVAVASDVSEAPEPFDLIVDGLIGYSLQGAPRGDAADLIRWANVQGGPILALDVPSGVDAGTGVVFTPAVRALATLTLALPKEGLRTPSAVDHVGELYLADIGVPPELYAGPGIGVEVGPLFARADILRLR
jgi:NAD(P)H-hydrate epimerase